VIKIQLLKESIKAVLKELEYQKYSKCASGTHSYIYNGILRYMQANKISTFNEKVCIDYVFSLPAVRDKSISPDHHLGKGLTYVFACKALVI